MPLTAQLTTEQKQHFELTPTTAEGNAATLVGTPVWTVTSGAGTVTPDADGLGAFISSTDTVDGVPTVVSVTAEGDPTPGVDTLTDTITVTTVAAEAFGLGIKADAPIAK